MLKVLKDNMANLSDVIYKMIDNAHPVGSYYLTETDTNPSAILHVGTWVQLKDRMLIGCGDSFAISSEGGEKEHVLSTSELPSHTHGLESVGGYDDLNWVNGDGAFHIQNSDTTVGWSGATNAKPFYGNTNASGGGRSHNNMPPYHSCYIWRRTA